MDQVRKGKKFGGGGEGSFALTELLGEPESPLDLLSLSRITVAASASPRLSYPDEECLLFLLSGRLEVELEGAAYELEKYDVLYVPVGCPFRVRGSGDEAASAYLYRALGKDKHPHCLARWEERRKDPARLRLLKGKKVYLMFDVTEPANRLMAGYTFYEPETRAWPPHNHRDQEEIYSFIEGRGSMAVYETDESMSFVVPVETGDHVAIPLMNYHPVFSQEEPLAFIWCIAGERYWVGDKNKDFMSGTVDKLTT